VFEPDQARALAAALLRAADEAEGKPADTLGSYRDAVTNSERARIATFIRANVNMQGLDFADAEAVADWLEGE
jgi:hypothetical protein